jgi:Leucine-rich repeat (LRR) protein
MKSNIIVKLFLIQLIYNQLLAEELICNLEANVPLDCFVLHAKFTTDTNIVYTNLGKNFTAFEIYSSEIANIFQNLFIDFPFLQTFTISDSIFSTIRSTDFNGANRLIYLYLVNTTVKALTNNIFQNCKNLIILSVVNGVLDSIDKDALKGLKKLKQLNFFKNQLAELQSGTLDDMLNLVSFNCYMNSITAIPSDLFNKATKLEAIDFSFNKIVTIDDTTFSNLPVLNTISLNDNQLIGFKAPQAAFLILTNNQIKIFHISQHIQQLSIANNSLEKITCDKNLGATEINANQNNLRNLLCIKSMVNLTNLDVSRNKISKLNKKPFTRLTKLWYLNINGNPKRIFPTNMFTSLQTLITLRVDGLRNYQIVKKVLPKLIQIKINTDNWNCSHAEKVAEFLEKQRIKYDSIDRYTNFKRFKCQVPFLHILD